MFSSKIKQFVFKSPLGRLLGGTYVVYLVVLMIGSAQIGLQLGAELRSVPSQDRAQYIESFLIKKL